MLYIEHKFKDGSSVKQEVVKKASQLGQRFEEKKGARAGEYYLIDQQGHLQIGDKDGVITTATRVVKPPIVKYLGKSNLVF